ncbi:hypothetical protein K493DRAFT_239885 [Basidiobolus meristosporus CBS 931.73]|uniref:1,3-beta-glucanosyltransferase n=1 Tax=Basidiobolus meristosporus CBS 931.73 TaxID=1314790 RepID=A0A1Y1XD25_9FUNG|nr:hypothetical protein K493DRAFT_239885 [Basidiobolus meristosporus CBS 931.73]|eukprot:ORX83639.1 hypothetical protein K493DRAFT_239885 [Basidiobolus meristosporus CBS 931.73]
MKLSAVLSSISLVLCASHASAINPLIIKGSKFFDSVTGDQFYIKGVAYQPSGQTGANKDPLANIQTCTRDIAYFQDLGLNTIRVYQVDNTLNHDACMKALAAAGIYLVLDISSPSYSINRADPSYDIVLLDNYKKTIDAFSDYPNVIGFFAGNEVVNNVNATKAAPFVKASIRDVKKYVKTKKRQIPVGYSTNDAAVTRVDCADYFNCGDADERVDFYGYNIYSWCGDEATFQSSQYAARTEQFSTYSVPVFLSEFGCNTNGVRSFHQVASIFGPDMKDTFSGGIVYEYTQEPNNYGLVKIEADGGVTKRPCYENLKNEMSKVRLQTTKLSSYMPSRVPSQCPSISSTWLANSKIPSTPSEKLCSSMVDSLKCVFTNATGNTPDMEKLFAYLCNEASCTEIIDNGETGVYGMYSGCEPEQRLSYMFNEYYTKNGEKDTSCSFDGFGAVVTPTKAAPTPIKDSDNTSSTTDVSSSSIGKSTKEPRKQLHQGNGAGSLSTMSVLTLLALSAVSFANL